MELNVQQQQAMALARARQAQQANSQPQRPELFPGANAAETAWFQGLTAGFGDEIASALGTPIQMGIDAVQGKPFDPGRSFNTQLEQNQATMAADTEGHPVATALGNVGGALNLGGTLARGGLSLMNGAKPTVASLLTRGGAEGALYGGAYGAGEAEGGLANRLEAAGWGALWGAITGAGTGAVGGSIAKSFANRSIPEERALADQADQLYRAAEQNGVTASQQQTQQLAGQLRQIATDEGLITPAGRVTGNSNIQHILNTVDDYANGTMSVPQMQTVRKLFRDAAQSSDASERRLGSIMIEQFDNFTAPLAPELAQAREVYTRLMKSREIGRLIERAELNAGRYSQSGMENALRQEFRALSRKIVNGQARGFSAEEAEAIRQVADGGTMANFFQRIGKWAPTGPVSAGLGGGGAAIAGLATGNPLLAAGGAALMGTGAGSRAVATALTKNAAQHANNLARVGGSSNLPAIQSVPMNALTSLIAANSSQAPRIPGGVRALPNALSRVL